MAYRMSGEQLAKAKGSIKKTGSFDGKSNKLGGGGRFAQVEAKAKASGARNPGAVAAAAGRKSLGPKAFNQLALQGRERKPRLKRQMTGE